MVANEVKSSEINFNGNIDKIWVTVATIVFTGLQYLLGYILLQFPKYSLHSTASNTVLVSLVFLAIFSLPILYFLLRPDLSFINFIGEPDYNEMSRIRIYFFSRMALVPFLLSVFLVFITLTDIGFISQHGI